MSDDPSKMPAPEVLQPQSEDGSAPEPAPDAAPAAAPAQPATRLRRPTYRPSHKATFIGLGVVVVILAINVGVIAFVMRGQNEADAQPDQNQVTISSSALEKLGVSRNSVGSLGSELVVNPKSKFNGKVTVASDIDVAGQLKLNSKFVAPSAAIAKLESGDVAATQLNVNGDAAATNLNLRKDLSVAGLTRLQGPVTISQILTVNNSMNVAGNLGIGGTLSVRSLQVSSFTSDTTLTIGGHIITRGTAPSVSAGSVGMNGTVSISGNDASGTVAVNVGAGGASGILANVAFRNNYNSTPHVVVTQIGAGGNGVYITRTVGGFSIGVNGTLGPGGYAFDYIVMQ